MEELMPSLNAFKPADCPGDLGRLHWERFIIMIWSYHQEFSMDSIFMYIEQDGLQEKLTTAITFL